MPATDLALLAAGYALAVLTGWEMARGWFRHPTRYRADIFMVVAILVGILLAGGWVAAASVRHPAVGIVAAFCFLAQPYFLLRLVRPFRVVPLVITGGCLVAAVLAALLMRQPDAGSTTGILVVAGYFVLTLSYAAWAFGREAGKASGVTARRLRLTAIGTWIHVLIAVLYAVDGTIGPLGTDFTSLRLLLGVSVLACYYVGLVGPRRVRAAWANEVLFSFFRDAIVASAGPIDIGATAAAVERAAGSTVSSVARLVVLVADGTPSEGTVRAASRPEWVGRRLRIAGGPIDQSIQAGITQQSRLLDCEPDVRALIGDAGSSAVIVPIPGSDDVRGALIVIQQQGSLFPYDDRQVLSVLCAYFGLVLDRERLMIRAQQEEQRLVESRLRQTERIVALGRLAIGISHDFGNLLVAMGLELGMIETAAESSPDVRNAVDSLRHLVRRATDLTGHLAAFGRRREVQVRPVDLADIIRDLQSTLRRLLDPRIEILFVEPRSPLWVMGDRIHLEQVTLNLAINARDAMPEGGRLLIDLAVTAKPADLPMGSDLLGADSYVRLRVSDTGFGMDEDTARHVFDQYFTTKGAGHGTGLGLSIVHDIVEQFGGVVGVHTRLGHGTTFEVHLPQVTEPALRHVGTQNEAPGGPTARAILLVQSGRASREEAAAWLRAEGYEVVLADSITDALVRMTTQDRLDLLVTDVVMPGGTGNELLEVLRADRPGLRAVFVSGFSVDALVEHALMAQGAPFLAKPVDREALIRKVRMMFDGRPAQAVRRR